MKLQDLRANDIITTRDGDVYILHIWNDDKLIGVGDNNYIMIDGFYFNDMKFKDRNMSFCDIIKVQRPKYRHQMMCMYYNEAEVIYDERSETYKDRVDSVIENCKNKNVDKVIFDTFDQNVTDPIVTDNEILKEEENAK